MIKTQDEIRQEVKRLFMSQTHVADELGIDRTNFNKWLHGNIRLGSGALDRVIGWMNERHSNNDWL